MRSLKGFAGFASIEGVVLFWDFKMGPESERFHLGRRSVLEEFRRSSRVRSTLVEFLG
jgi:hypothetical protein